VLASVMSDDRKLVIGEVAERAIGPGLVRLTVTRCGICGSDLHMRANVERISTGCIIGHEIAGVVSEVAQDEQRWKVGDRVAVYHSVSCGSCANCRGGYEYLCVQAARLSLGLGVVPGGYAESIVVPVSTLYAVPATMTDEQSALVEPLAIGMHGVARARLDVGGPVAVIGAGTIGAMTALALRSEGHENILFVEPNENRRALMERLGFASVGLDGGVDEIVSLLGERPGAVFECSGNAAALAPAAELVGYRGRLVLQGLPKKPAELMQSALILQ
jgi:(R,R)-butanediol dehydrogenase/meso-butanediol dehydrogenase/diacetyl reductase